MHTKSSVLLAAILVVFFLLFSVSNVNAQTPTNTPTATATPYGYVVAIDFDANNSNYTFAPDNYSGSWGLGEVSATAGRTGNGALGTYSGSGNYWGYEVYLRVEVPLGCTVGNLSWYTKTAVTSGPAGYGTSTVAYLYNASGTLLTSYSVQLAANGTWVQYSHNFGGYSASYMILRTGTYWTISQTVPAYTYTDDYAFTWTTCTPVPTNTPTNTVTATITPTGSLTPLPSATFSNSSWSDIQKPACTFTPNAPITSTPTVTPGGFPTSSLATLPSFPTSSFSTFTPTPCVYNPEEYPQTCQPSPTPVPTSGGVCEEWPCYTPTPNANCRAIAPFSPDENSAQVVSLDYDSENGSFITEGGCTPQPILVGAVFNVIADITIPILNITLLHTGDHLVIPSVYLCLYDVTFNMSFMGISVNTVLGGILTILAARMLFAMLGWSM